MNKMKRISLLVVAMMVFLVSAVPTMAKEKEAPVSREITNVQAFTKLYGYIRFFHPSDENEKIDWQRFAIYGVSKARAAKSDKELTAALQELFYPIAPTMRFTNKDKAARLNRPKQARNLTAWLHQGVKMNSPQEMYTSERLQSEGTSEILLQKHILKPGEVVVKQITPGVFAHIPIVLYRDSKGTIGATAESADRLTKLQQQLAKIKLDKVSLNDRNVQLANVVITWNAIQHFYPYFDVVKVDWERTLIDALQQSLNNRTLDQYSLTMKRMLAKLQDGHSLFIVPELEREAVYAPYRVEWIEDQVVVTNAKEETGLKPGDVILMINGKKADSHFKELELTMQGSRQYKRILAAREFYIGKKGTEARLTVQRGKTKLDLTILYGDRTVEEFITPGVVEQVKDGIYYVNLTRLTEDMFQQNLSKLGHAKGVIFDLRGYPYPGTIGINILKYLTDSPFQTPQFHMPLFVFPDHENVKFNLIQYTHEPEKSKLKGKVAFLTYGGAVSYSETIMGIVEHYRLADIIGQPTAGANGDANFIQLPGGCIVGWTGLVTLKQDGSQHHLIGIQPTVLVQRTIKEVREGRDVYLEKAIETINAKQNNQ
ncbi:S41 family peptidase [Paenibacillus tuaregi]|uniref:S41 family peptidase n=1 Tax=Paenibacillus tuaregi TaxID=1816681 RepID=UPI000839ADE8|nr:S41 family peptidase [Paenibacillus tuaregi]